MDDVAKIATTINERSSSLLYDNRIEQEWLTTIQASLFLGITPNALRIMVCRGQIPFYKLGRRLRFKVLDFRSLFQKKGT